MNNKIIKYFMLIFPNFFSKRSEIKNKIEIFDIMYLMMNKKLRFYLAYHLINLSESSEFSGED